MERKLTRGIIIFRKGEKGSSTTLARGDERESSSAPRTLLSTPRRETSRKSLTHLTLKKRIKGAEKKDPKMEGDPSHSNILEGQVGIKQKGNKLLRKYSYRVRTTRERKALILAKSGERTLLTRGNTLQREGANMSLKKREGSFLKKRQESSKNPVKMFASSSKKTMRGESPQKGKGSY